MGEIDFKSNKKKTREMLRARIEKQKKQDRICNIITTTAIILLFILFCMYNAKMTNDAINSCVESGKSKEYCEQVLG